MGWASGDLTPPVSKRGLVVVIHRKPRVMASRSLECRRCHSVNKAVLMPIGVNNGSHT